MVPTPFIISHQNVEERMQDHNARDTFHGEKDPWYLEHLLISYIFTQFSLLNIDNER